MASTSASGSKRKFEVVEAFDGITPSASTSTSKLIQRSSASTPSASTSASKLIKRSSYDVFIRHSGLDVKYTLASVLYGILTGMSFSVFLDSEELEYGDFFPQIIEAAMTSALLHIAIFSKSYADSPWCLAEFSFMLKTGTKIILIFYHVEPSDLRWVDRGKGMYARAFKEHERKGKYNLQQLQEWKNALYNLSFYIGEIIRTNEDEMRLLKNIVRIILKERNNVPLVVAKHPVGLEEIVLDFKSSTLQSAHSNQDVRIVGIWGKGGSGKTTLAKELYNQMCSSMERSSFLFDVQDVTTKGMLLGKQKQFPKDLGVQGLAFDNVEEGMRILAKSLSSLRVLIVCDDVDYVEQLDALLPRKDNLEKGSLIIVTTREIGVLKSLGISSIYKMRPLKPLYAKQFFVGMLS